MSEIARDERRWVILRVEPKTLSGGPLNAFVVGDVVDGSGSVDVVPASELRGAVAECDRLQRIVDEAYAAADAEDETTLSRVLEVLAPHVEAGGP